MIAPLISLSLLMIGSGLFNTFVSLRLHLAGYGTPIIGAVTSALYIGIFLGSSGAAFWITRLGHKRAFCMWILCLTIMLSLQALWLHPYVWALFRCAGGVAIAGICVVMESWLLLTAPKKRVGVALAMYLTVSYAAISIGQLLFAYISPLSLQPYFLAGAFTLGSILPLIRQRIDIPFAQEKKKKSWAYIYTLSPLGLIGGVAGGMILSSLYGLMPLYARQMGMSLSEIGYLMACLLLGGLSLQWPLGYWADRKDRRCMLRNTSLLAMITAISIAWMGKSALWSLLAPIWLFGGAAFAIYPLSLAYLCEKVSKEELVNASGTMLLFYGLGAIIGPLLAPFAMERFGAEGLFYFFAGITSLLTLTSHSKLIFSKDLPEA